MKEDELARISSRFEIAVKNFGQSTVGMLSNEKSFQAWFGAMVINEFGLSRVYREIHIPKMGLEFADYEASLPSKLTKGNELFPDISVSWIPAIDTRHASTRSEQGWEKASREIFKGLAIVSELKVTSSTKVPTSKKMVLEDLLKLHIFAETHRVHASQSPLRTYMIILDNHEVQTFGVNKMKDIFDEVHKVWPNCDFNRPDTMVISSNSGHTTTTIYRDCRVTEGSR
jgi:hypothetical protein